MNNVKLILETGCNHQGDIKIAKRMIELAGQLGADAVKFQKRDIEEMPNELKNKKRSLSNSFGETYYEHRKVLEFDNDQMQDLLKCCTKHNLVFMCSAFDKKSIFDLVEIGCGYIKLPSQLYTDNNLKDILLDIRKKRNIKILVSTGMHEESEIFSNSWITEADFIFHCVSVYPVTLTNMNLYTLKKLDKKATGQIGYSSHENEGYGIPYAVLAGANYIERHFTLDKEWKGSDHGTVSSDPPEIQKIISDIKWIERILGNEKRACSLKEREVRNIYRGF